MPSEGPSKEELEYYYKNSRKYFDELAKHYYETDRDYYNKNIAPFYSSFGSITAGTKSSSGPRASLAIVAALVALAIGFAAYLIMQGTQEVEYDNQKSTEDAGKKTQKEPVREKKSAVTDYRKGLDYYNDREYDNAEKYFKKVTKDDENYEDAQKKIEEIEELKKSEEKNEDNNSRDRYSRPKPVERIR